MVLEITSEKQGVMLICSIGPIKVRNISIDSTDLITGSLVRIGMLTVFMPLLLCPDFSTPMQKNLE